MRKISTSNAIIYCRTGCEGGDNGTNHAASQETRCREYAADKRYNVIQVFHDTAVSANEADRPGIQAMLTFLKRRSGAQPHVVIIDDPSRLARKLEIHNLLSTAIDEAGGRLESSVLNIQEKDRTRTKGMSHE